MIDESRNLFEAWCIESGWSTLRDDSGYYITTTTDAAWGGWMAALNIYGVFGQPCDDDTEYLK